MGLRGAVQMRIERQGLQPQALALGIDQLEKGLAQILLARGREREEKDGQEKKTNPLRS